MVRIRFSFLSDAVAVMDIAPSEDVVRQRQLNEMVDEVTLHLAACREIWWDGKRTTCLQNMWLMLAGFDGLAVVDGQRPGARQVRFARYDVLARRTILVFSDGTDHSISAGRAE